MHVQEFWILSIGMFGVFIVLSMLLGKGRYSFKSESNSFDNSDFGSDGDGGGDDNGD